MYSYIFIFMVKINNFNYYYVSDFIFKYFVFFLCKFYFIFIKFFRSFSISSFKKSLYSAASSAVEKLQNIFS